MYSKSFAQKPPFFEGYFSPDFYEKIRERFFDIHYSLFTSEAPVAPARVVLLKDTLLGSKKLDKWIMDYGRFGDFQLRRRLWQI